MILLYDVPTEITYHNTYFTYASGGDGNLVLSIGTYGPNPPAAESVRCMGRIPNVGSCRDAITRVPVSHQPEIFGPEQDPRRDIQIPRAINSCRNFHPSIDCFPDIRRRLHADSLNR